VRDIIVENIFEIIALVVVVVGWVITYYLTLQAQKKHLRHGVLDEARRELSGAIREYQSWLSRASASVRAPKSLLESGGLIGWKVLYERWEKLVSSDEHLNWIRFMEEYEIIFPNTASIRSALIEKHQYIQRGLTALLKNVVMDGNGFHVDSTDVLNTELGTLPGLIADQLSLMEQLRIFLQNETLSEIMGRRMPDLIPPDANAPRIVSGRSGQLEISEGND
jgi:hypothetical protein